MNIDIYCDESRLEFLESQDNGFMVIGSLWLNREKRDIVKNRIKELKRKPKMEKIITSVFHDKIIFTGTEI